MKQGVCQNPADKPEKVYKSIPVCQICLESLVKDIYVEISCGQVFHEKCIFDVYKKRSECPNCRAIIEKEHLKKVLYNLEDNDNEEFNKQYIDEKRNMIKKDCIINSQGQKIIEQKDEIDILYETKEKLEKEVEYKDKKILSITKVPTIEYKKIANFPEMKPIVLEVYKKFKAELENKLETFKTAFKETTDSDPNLIYEHKAKKSTYQGSFLQKRRFGIGKLMYENGSYFEGTFVSDYFDGFGIYIKPSGSYAFGEWRKDKLHGHAKFVSKKTDIYEGSWKKGKKHGYGLETIVNYVILIFIKSIE